MADSPHSDNAASFDAYYELLGIPPAEQPPTHYRLLGLSPLESNPKIIERAADRQMSHLRTFKAGQQAVASQKLLSEVAKASRVLLTPEEKAVYDATLTQLTAAKPVAPLRPIAAKPLAPAIAPAKPIPLQTTIPLPVDVVDPAAFSQLDAGSSRSRKSNSSNLPLIVSGVASFALVVLIAVVFVLMNRGNRPADIVEVDRANVSPTDPTDQPGETPPSPPPVAPEVPPVATAPVPPVPPNPPASAAVTPPGVEPIAETGNAAADTQSPNAVVSTPPKPANKLPPGRWVDLLALVRLPDDAVSGNWTLRDGRASIDGKSGGKLKLPVDLTGASYDLQVEFESDSDPGNVNVMLPVGDRSVLVVGDGYQNVGTWSYFSLVGNKEPPQVPGSVQGPVLEAGKRYTYDISVRLNGDQARLAVSLNNKPLYHYDGPIAALRIVPAYKLENEGWPGLASWFSPIDYVGCKVRLESGRATFTRNATTSWTEGAVLAFTFDNNTISRRDGQLVVRDLSGHNNH